tara:strand:- start:2241 stop:2444 length:204 start_codon:yes stop_codon:yes gene_type:complete
VEADKLATALREKLRTLMNEHTDSVALGSAQSYDQYQRMVGQIEGLAIAERELLSLAKKTDEDEEDF